MSRFVRFAILFGLAVLFAVTAAPRCYEPGTGVVVFVQGIYTYLDEDGTQATMVEEHRFDALKSALRANGYDDGQLLDFSYNGGTVSVDGTWEPDHYQCAETDRPSAQNIAALEQMLRDYLAKHPKSHFILVGHSLGGYLSFLTGARDATRPPGERVEISAVATLDAPLNGVSADKKFVLDLIPCEKTYVAGGELVIDGANASIREIRRYQAGVMAQEGVRLATIGNLHDCLYNTVGCTGIALVNDAETQFIDNAQVVKRYDAAADALASHDFILAFPPAVQDVVAFVGPGDP